MCKVMIDARKILANEKMVLSSANKPVLSSAHLFITPTPYDRQLERHQGSNYLSYLIMCAH